MVLDEVCYQPIDQHSRCGLVDNEMGYMIHLQNWVTLIVAMLMFIAIFILRYYQNDFRFHVGFATRENRSASIEKRAIKAD